jgi:hypothetical protein
LDVCKQKIKALRLQESLSINAFGNPLDDIVHVNQHLDAKIHNERFVIDN